MSTKFKTGDKVRVMHSFMNKQGKKGKLVVINEEENDGLVKFKDGSEYWYNLSDLEKVKKKKKSVTAEVGKCYKNEVDEYVKVTGTDRAGNPEGTSVDCFKDFVCVVFDTPLYMFFESKVNEIEECTHEEFEQKLQEAAGEMTRIYKQLKSESDEKANTKGTEMA